MHWNFALANSTTLRPGIRTFKPRRSRITRREQRALDNPGGLLLTQQESTLNFPALFGVTTPPILEIGFGITEAITRTSRCSNYRFAGQNDNERYFGNDPFSRGRDRSSDEFLQ